MYSMIVSGVYGDHDPSVVVAHESDRPEKQRAEVATLISDVLDWACANDFEILVGSSGRVLVKDLLAPKPA